MSRYGGGGGGVFIVEDLYQPGYFGCWRFCCVEDFSYFLLDPLVWVVMVVMVTHFKDRAVLARDGGGGWLRW